MKNNNLELDVRRIVSKKQGLIYTVVLDVYRMPCKIASVQSVETGKYYKMKPEAEKKMLRKIDKYFTNQDPYTAFNDKIDEFTDKHPVISRVIFTTISLLACIGPV